MHSRILPHIVELSPIGAVGRHLATIREAFSDIGPVDLDCQGDVCSLAFDQDRVDAMVSQHGVWETQQRIHSQVERLAEDLRVRHSSMRIRLLRAADKHVERDVRT